MSNAGYSVIAFLVTMALVVSSCGQPESEQVMHRQQNQGPAGVAGGGQGEILFDTHCARCHGKSGGGTDRGPPLIHLIYRPGHHSDMSFQRAAKDGVTQHHWHFGDMPPVSGVSPEEVGHIIAYIRQVQRHAGIF